MSDQQQGWKSIFRRSLDENRRATTREQPAVAPPIPPPLNSLNEDSSRNRRTQTDSFPANYLESDDNQNPLLAAQVHEKRGQIDLAIEAYTLASTMEKHRVVALESLVRIHESQSSWHAFVTTISKLISVTPSRKKKALLCFKYGSVLETQFQDDKLAEKQYISALSYSKSCLPAIHGLRDIYSRSHDWEGVVNTLIKEAAVTRTPRNLSMIFARIGSVYWERLSNVSQSVTFYEKALKTHSGCAPAMFALFYIFNARNRTQDALSWGPICNQHISSLSAINDKAKFLINWTELLLDSGDKTQAMASVVSLRELQPNHESTHQLVLKMARQEVSRELRQVIRLEDESTAHKSNTSVAMLAQAKALIAMEDRDYDLARALFSKSAEKAPHKADCVLGYAVFLSRLGYISHALDFVDYCRTRISNGTEHIILIDEWITMSIWMAKQYAIHQRKYKQSIQICFEVLSAQPNNANCLQIATDCSVLFGDWELALRFAERLSGVLPTENPSEKNDILDLIDFCKLKKDETESAIADWEGIHTKKKYYSLRYIVWLLKNDKHIKVSDIVSKTESIGINSAADAYLYGVVLILSGLNDIAQKYIEKSTYLDPLLRSTSVLKLHLGNGNLAAANDIAKKSFKTMPYQSFYFYRYLDCLRLSEQSVAPHKIFCEQILSIRNEKNTDEIHQRLRDEYFISNSMKFVIPGRIEERLTYAANATCNQPIARAWQGFNRSNIFQKDFETQLKYFPSAPKTIERAIEETLEQDILWHYGNRRHDRYIDNNRFGVGLNKRAKDLPQNLRRNYLLFVGTAIAVGLPNIVFFNASTLRENIEKFSLLFSNDVKIDRSRSIVDIKISRSDQKIVESFRKELDTPFAELQTLTLHWMEQCYYTIAKLVIQLTGDMWSIAKILDFLFHGDLIEHDSIYAGISYGPEATKLLTYFISNAFEADQQTLFSDSEAPMLQKR